MDQGRARLDLYGAGARLDQSDVLDHGGWGQTGSGQDYKRSGLVYFIWVG